MAGNPSDLISCSNPGIQAWLQVLAGRRGNFSALLAGGDSGGFGHTLREICQQPATWTETARCLLPFREAIAANLASCRRIVLTGSGSSQYAGECAATLLRRRLRRSVVVAGGGDVLLSRGSSSEGEPALVVSLARSGESPESVAVVETLLETERETRHLIITCNSDGRLAREFAGTPRVTVITLGEDVNDRSLVMTSSFTNLVLGASFLGWLDRTEEFEDIVQRVSRAGMEILEHWPDCLAELVSGPIERIIFLGSGSRFGTAREGALKLLEMTAGKVATMAETYLGFRHGPMCFANDRTLIVCFLSADPLIRRYEEDLIRELREKKLGARKLIAGVSAPGQELLGPQDLSIPYMLPERTEGTEDLLDAMLAQIMGFHRCRMEGLQPDSPSVDGVISRVVGGVTIHRPEVKAQ